MPTVGFTRVGDGPTRVIVLHDWFCDHSTWDAALPYLTPSRFTYVFTDLRGYGKSLGIEGAYTLEEAASDVIALADHLGWDRFALIGHSMSGLIVQRLAQLVPDRIARIVAITPIPPGGMKPDKGTLDSLRSLALAGDEGRFTVMGTFWGTRLSESWIKFKLLRWRETASPVAVAKYVEMWANDISQAARGIATPMLIVAAAQDAPPFQAAALEASMLPYYPNARLISFAESGHYPMQEQPPMVATVVERFLGE